MKIQKYIQKIYPLTYAHLTYDDAVPIDLYAGYLTRKSFDTYCIHLANEQNHSRRNVGFDDNVGWTNEFVAVVDNNLLNDEPGRDGDDAPLSD